MIPALLALLWYADVRGCACDPKAPATLEAKECGLCKAAEAQPAEPAVFFLKDTNPTKPNRTLALPRQHYPGPHSLAQMSAPERVALWTAAIAKAKELWGDDWALAYNGEERRTQCHGHVHIGKHVDETEEPGFAVVRGAAEIPVPEGGAGLWLHPAAGGAIHVHAGEQVTEFHLMR